MASRRASNGSSPLVRKQSQITAFFSSSPIPSPPPSGPSPGASKPSPSPLNPSARTRSPLAAVSPSPPKPQQPQQKQKKGKKDKEERDAVAAVPAPLAAEVVGRRLRVYWPLDDAWYKGRVEAYDAASRRHRVKYDDGDEEKVDLGKEKFEWEAAVEDSTPPPARKLRRLRRMSDTSVAKSQAVAEDSAGDSTEDEDWKRDTVVEDDSEEVELDEEDDEEVVAVRARKGKPKNSLLMSGSTPSTLGSGLTSESGSKISKKRKNVDVASLDFAKRFTFEAVNTTRKVDPEVPMSCGQKGQTMGNDYTALTGDAAERFGQRDAEKFKFLGEGRKDAKGRRPGSPGFDPRTLLLPPQFLKSLTGGQRQWWEFKSQHMDKVLFFKMGKFYELFEMNAHVGAKDLDLQYIKGEQPHCGFPETNLSANLEKLAEKGYRVLVVEQTETPEQLELRRKEMGIKDKAVTASVTAAVPPINPERALAMEFARRELEILRLYATQTRLRQPTGPKTPQPPLGWELPEITITVKKPRSCERAKSPSPRRWSCAVCQVDAASERELQLHRARAGKKHRAKSNAAAVEARTKAIGALKVAKPKKRRLQYKAAGQENEANVEQKSTEFNEPTRERTAGVKRKLTAPSSPVKKQKPLGQWSCTVCQVNPASRRQLKEHLAGKRHRSNVEELQTSRSRTGIGWTCTLCQAKGTSESDYYSYLGGRRHREKAQARRAEPSRFYCAVCDLQCSSEIMLASHLGGRRHLGVRPGLAACSRGWKLLAGFRNPDGFKLFNLCSICLFEVPLFTVDQAATAVLLPNCAVGS